MTDPIERTYYGLRNESLGLVSDYESKPECHECGPLDLTLHGISRAAIVITEQTRLLAERAEAAAAVEPDEIAEGILVEHGDLSDDAADLLTSICSTRKGLGECPGRTDQKTCGLSRVQQHQAFYKTPPPMFILGKRYRPGEDDDFRVG